MSYIGKEDIRCRVQKRKSFCSLAVNHVESTCLQQREAFIQSIYL